MEKLTLENINNAVASVEEFLSPGKIDKKESLRICLGIEEALLDYRENFGEEAEFELRFGNFLGNRKIQILVPGESFDPFTANKSDDESSAMMRSMLIALGKRPAWNYYDKINTLTFTVARKALPGWAKLCIAVVAAAVLSFILKLFPAEISEFVQTKLLSPVLSTFIGFLNAIAGPMIFLAVVWGIYSMGDTDQFSKLGKLLSKKLAQYILVTALIVFFLSLPFFDLVYGNNTGGDGFSTIYQMVLDIIPTNLFTPFTTGNTLQILFVSIIAGVAMIITGEKVQVVATFAEQLNLIISVIMKAVTGLIPFYIFGSLLNLFLTSSFSGLGIAVKLFAGTAAACLFIMLLHTVYASIKSKEPFLQIWKKSFEVYLLALSTSSSSACFSTNLSTCIDKYGMDRSFVNFGVPFLQVLYKPSVMTLYMICAFCMAENAALAVSSGWLATTFIMCIVLSVAAPPIPGGCTTSLTILFMQLGLPMESLAIALTITSLLDPVLTSSDIVCGEALLLDAFREYKKQ